jgi:hypothetical protein
MTMDSHAKWVMGLKLSMITLILLHGLFLVQGYSAEGAAIDKVDHTFALICLVQAGFTADRPPYSESDYYKNWFITFDALLLLGACVVGTLIALYPSMTP